MYKHTHWVFHSTFCLVSVQPLTLPKKLNAFLFQLELLNFPACGLRVIIDPEDVLRYYMFLVSFMRVFRATWNSGKV